MQTPASPPASPRGAGAAAAGSGAGSGHRRMVSTASFDSAVISMGAVRASALVDVPADAASLAFLRRSGSTASLRRATAQQQQQQQQTTQAQQPQLGDADSDAREPSSQLGAQHAHTPPTQVQRERERAFQHRHSLSVSGPSAFAHSQRSAFGAPAAAAAAAHMRRVSDVSVALQRSAAVSPPLSSTLSSSSTTPPPPPSSSSLLPPSAPGTISYAQMHPARDAHVSIDVVSAGATAAAPPSSSASSASSSAAPSFLPAFLSSLMSSSSSSSHSSSSASSASGSLMRFPVTASIYLLGWTLASVASAILNGSLLAHHQCPKLRPSYLFALQLVASCIVTALMTRGRRPSVWAVWKIFLPLGFGMLLSNLFSYGALALIPVSFNATIKASTPVFSAINSWCRGVRLSRRSLVTVLVVVFGVCLASFKELALHPIGVLFALAASAALAVQSFMAKQVLRRYDASSAASRRVIEVSRSFHVRTSTSPPLPSSLGAPTDKRATTSSASAASSSSAAAAAAAAASSAPGSLSAAAAATAASGLSSLASASSAAAAANAGSLLPVVAPPPSAMASADDEPTSSSSAAAGTAASPASTAAAGAAAHFALDAPTVQLFTQVAALMLLLPINAAFFVYDAAWGSGIMSLALPYLSASCASKLAVNLLAFVVHTSLAFRVLDALTPLSYAVANALKRVTVIAFSVMVFHTPITPLNVFGIVLAVAGGFLYSRVREPRDASSKR